MERRSLNQPATNQSSRKGNPGLPDSRSNARNERRRLERGVFLYGWKKRKKEPNKAGAAKLMRRLDLEVKANLSKTTTRDPAVLIKRPHPLNQRIKKDEAPGQGGVFFLSCRASSSRRAKIERACS